MEHRITKRGKDDRSRRVLLGLLLRENHDKVFGQIRLERVFDAHKKTYKYRFHKMAIVATASKVTR